MATFQMVGYNVLVELNWIELNPAACVLNYGKVIVSLLFINPVSPHFSISGPAVKFGTI